MNIVVDIVKDIPEKDIDFFEDKVVYYSAIDTREYVKGSRAYPYLTGELERTEVASPITGGNKEYNLLSGVAYAKYVWKMNNVKWTNTSTLPQWYYRAFEKRGKTITTNASMKAMKELNK